MLDPFLITDSSPLECVPIAPSDTNVTSLRTLSQEREQALIERARSGDQTARDELLLALLPSVKRFAQRYFLTHSWEVSGSLSPDDLVADATVRMLEYFRTALAATNPCAYLLAAAYGTIRHALWQESSPIRTPQTPGERPIPVTSVDAPLTAESEDTLLDVFVCDVDIHSCTDGGEYTALYQAIGSLSAAQRVLIAQDYGVWEADPPLADGTLTCLGSKAKALAKLYRLLTPVYPQYAGPGYLQELRVPARPVALSEGQQHRLDAAYVQLQESGQKITLRTLKRAAGVNSVYASAYLHQHGYMRPGRQQRLDAAYAQLQASDQDITPRELAYTAHVGEVHASLYLHQHGSAIPRHRRVRPTEDRAVRVAAAYAQLQESGQTITRRTLGTAARVNWQYAAAYIQQRQAGDARREASTSSEVSA